MATFLSEAPDERVEQSTLRERLPVNTGAAPDPPAVLSVPAADDTVVGRFEHWVHATPKGLAVKADHESLTYSLLDQRANNVAHGILTRDPAPGAPIAIVLPIGIDVSVAMLGVLKAGRFYVVIDPQHPAARNEHIAADARPAMFLTNAATASAALRLAGTKVPVLVIDELDPCPVGPPDATVRPDDLAWLIYTSGSTGKPKGIVQSHRNAVHNVRRQQTLAGWSPGDRMTWLYSPGVMGATRGLTAALLNGAALFPRDPRQDSPAALIRWLHDEQITIFHSVASLFRTVFGAAGERIAPLPSLRLAIFGGERVGREEVELARRHLPPGCRIYTGLGTTETGTVSHVLIDPHAVADDALPLGAPVADVHIELRDETGRPAAPGDKGEIVVTSPYLAIGYWSDRDAAGGAFRASRAMPGAREYRTGDLGYWDPDGLLRHAGRSDFQVKIRGFRVELGEIESALQQHPAVSEAVVLGQAPAGGDPWLAAYCVCTRAAAPTPGELGRFMRERLPRHMIPAAFAFLPALPRTANGKLDRRALPVLSPAVTLEAEAFTAPCTGAEEKLAEIWSTVLDRRPIGRHDNFHELGGHSLSAMQVAARIHRAFGVELAPRLLFEHPTVAELAPYVTQLAAAPGKPAAAPLVRTRHEALMPLSFAQERLWFLDQLDGGSQAYHISRAFRLRGALDVAALRRALSAIVERHEILRTVYTAIDGEPRARVLAPAPVPLGVIDVDAADAPRGFAEAEAVRPFDLTRDVLLRAALGRISDDDWVLVLTMHHIASDGWSLALLLRELSSHYAAARVCAAPPPQELDLQYADYALWQRARLHGAELERQLGFWRTALAGAQAVLELPADFPRPSKSNGGGAVHEIVLPKTLVHGMTDLAQRAGVTPFVAWLAAFNVLLSRLTGRSDLLVGVPVAGRSRVELEPLIGFFVNTLVFRANVAGDSSFAEFLARFGRHAGEVFAHDEVPFEKLVQALQPVRHPAQPALVQVMFAWQNTPRAALALPGIDPQPLGLETRHAKLDLTLVLEADGESLRGSFEFSTELFRAETIRRIAERFVTLVAGIVSRPDERIIRLPLLPEAERRELVDWSGAKAEMDRPGTALEGFARHAARSPNAIAIRAGGRELTYAALAARADRVAVRLAALGVRPGHVVGVCLGRTLELAEALLGVLQAGAAFVPLDPSYPRERLEFMLSDSGAAVVIASAASGRVATTGVTVLELGASGEMFDRAPMARGARPLPSPDDTAYVIYTSGSTGRPKAVAVPHRALWQHNVAIGAAYSLRHDDRVLQFAALGFDVSLEEIFPTWVHGATVILRNEAAAQSLAAFVEFVQAEGITVLNLPTAFWGELVDGLEAHPLPPCVRLVVIGGEKATVDQLRRWQRRVGSRVQLVNGYGPTEATITATLFDATRHAGDTISGSLPIGRPIAGTRAYVLNEAKQFAPIGVWGELHLGGACLARGYLNRPELTSEKFVPDPLAGCSEARMYCTGDFVRWMADGELEFRGRIDEQVKWRGFRIELGEIENALRRLPGVALAAVVLREDVPGAPRLVGYVTPGHAASEPAAALAALHQMLPGFMVPTDLVGLETLPLTPAGKLDRRSLPPPASRGADGGVPPAKFSRREARLQQVWRDVLGVEIASPDANFFELGGNSLLGVRLFARIEAQLGVQPPLAALFTHPTLRQLSALLEQQPSRGESREIITLKPGSRTGSLVCVPGAGAGLLWGYTNLAAQYPADQAIHLLSPLGAAAASAAGSVEELAARYVARLRGFQPRGPYHLAGYCFGGNVAYEMARQLEAAGERVGLLAVFDSAPSNSAYYRVRLNRQFLAGFGRNLWLALEEFARMPASERSERLRVTARKSGRRVARLLGWRSSLTDAERQEMEIDAILPDHELYPAEELNLWRTHLQMLDRYHPQPSSVRVVLFRTRRRPLWRSHEPSLGWAALAGGGVAIEMVPGTHGTLFREPHVASLATRLAAHLGALSTGGLSGRAA